MSILFASNYKTYINHTDAGGIVYHGNYLTFYENCRRDWFTLLGFDGYFISNTDDNDPDDEVKAVFHPVVSDARVKYFKPILLDQKIQVTIDEVKVKPASLVFTQSILAAEDVLGTQEGAINNTKKLSTCTITIACVVRQTEKGDDGRQHNNLRVARLPKELVEAIESWQPQLDT